MSELYPEPEVDEQTRFEMCAPQQPAPAKFARLLRDIESFKPSRPSEYMKSLKSLVSSEVVRRANQENAVRDMICEQIKRVQATRMHTVLQDVIRQVARSNAQAAAHEEQCRRIMTESRHALCEQLRRSVAASMAERSAAAEQRARIESGVLRTYWTVDPAQINTTAKAKVNEDIHRRGNKWAARAMSQVAIDEAAHQHRMLQLCEELERAVNQSTAKLAANDEHRRRICEQWMHEVMSELRSAAAKRATAAAAEEEQRARVESGVHRTYWTVDPADVSAAKAPINEDIHRRGNTMIALECATVASAEQVHQYQMRDLCEQIERMVSQKIATQQEYAEQQRRIAEQWMHDVFDELRRTVARTQVATAVANESLQQNRVHYYCNAPSDVVNTHFEVNSDIERAQNQRNAIECMEIERFMRIQTEHMAAVADAVRRFVAQKDSLNTMSLETARAETRRQFDLVADAIRSRYFRQLASSAARMEQIERVNNPTPPTAEFARCYSEVNRAIELASDGFTVIPMAC